MKLNTDAIDEHGHIDPRYTCVLDNSSPELVWGELPEGTASLVLIADDPDAQDRHNPGPFVHWVVYNIPGEVNHLPAGIPPQDMLPNGIRQGLNSYGKLGYTGPCPPRGDRPHRYFFRLYALSGMPELPPRITAQQLLESIRPVTLGSVAIMGYFQRALERAV